MTFDCKKHWADPSQASDEVRAINNGKLFEYTQVDFYLRSAWGVQIALRYIPKYVTDKDAAILEMGCNTGHTLVALKQLGYTNLQGVEINQKAIDKGRSVFPELKSVPITCAPLEDVVRDMPNYHAMYCTGVFMHLPYSLDWVFEVLAKKITDVILTSENEYETDGYFKWARNYKDIYEGLGWKQIEQTTGRDFKPLPATTIIRVFTHG